jgi:hypothetical protein
MDKWTPGPWKLKFDTLWAGTTYLVAIVNSNGETIRVSGMALSSGAEPEANAKLIALAPELVTALRELRANETLDDDDARLVETRVKVDALLKRLES